MDNNQEVLLHVEHLCQYFKTGTKAVDDVSFDIMKGEVFGLVGETGAGKTTIINLLMRFYEIDGGSIKIKVASGIIRFTFNAPTVSSSNIKFLPSANFLST